MGMILDLMCEKLTGHRFGPWTRVEGFWAAGEWRQPRFERAQCRWCRQGYVRPMPLWPPPAVRRTGDPDQEEMMFDPENLKLAAAVDGAERDLLESVMDYYQHCQEHPSCDVPPMLVHPCRRVAELRAKRSALARPEAPEPSGEVERLRAENERLGAIVRGAWRFWAVTTNDSPTLLDRGYSVIRVRPDQYAAFDALFRSSAALSTTAAGGASDGGVRE